MKTVYQISDCHLSDESSYENLKQALVHAEQDTSCDTLLLTGDICCNPKSGDYAKLVAFVTQYVTSKTIFAIAGNHDDSHLMREELKGSVIQVADRAKIHGRDVLFLDSSYKPIDAQHPLGSGRIDNRGLAKFRKQIRKTSNPIVVIHHPVIPVGADWMQAIRLENDTQLMALLRKHQVKDVICGHGHDGIVETRQSVTQYMAPATAYGFDHSINEYNRSKKIGLSRITLSLEAIDYQAIYLC